MRAQVSNSEQTHEVTPEKGNWELEITGKGGFPPDYTIRSTLEYQEAVESFSAGVELGRMVTALHGKSMLRGRGEALVEIDPFWSWHEPRQTDRVQTSAGDFLATFAGFTDHGLLLTPIQFRWNFRPSLNTAWAPWVQAGKGILWTPNHFPQGTGLPGGNTSNVSFTPGIGVGSNVFVRRRQSFDFGAELFRVASYGLGEYDPGVVVLQFRVGYAWWK